MGDKVGLKLGSTEGNRDGMLLGDTLGSSDGCEESN